MSLRLSFISFYLSFTLFSPGVDAVNGTVLKPIPNVSDFLLPVSTNVAARRLVVLQKSQL